MLSNISILSKIKDLLDDNTIKIEDLNSSYIDIQEIANYFSSLMNEEFDISSLEKIEERIESYKRISRKHNIDENSLLDFKKKLTKIADSTYELEKITNDLENIYLENTKKYKDQSKKLSRLEKLVL